MRKSIADSITSTVKDLNRSGLVDDITMKNIENLCLPEIQEYSPEKIVSIRKNLSLARQLLPAFLISALQPFRSGNREIKNPQVLQGNS